MYYVLKCRVENQEFSEENYGVLLLNDDGSREYFCDVSDNINFVAALVDKLNNHHIDSCHLNSVIEDFKFTCSL